MAGGSPETGETFIQGAVDVDVSKFPALEAGFVISGMVTGEGCVIVTASPPDFSAFEGSFFISGQGRG